MKASGGKKPGADSDKPKKKVTPSPPNGGMVAMPPPKPNEMMMMGPPQTNSQYSNMGMQPETVFDDPLGGESVKVVVRVRPMNQMELERGDDNCTKLSSDKNIQIGTKYIFFFHISYHFPQHFALVEERSRIIPLTMSTLNEQTSLRCSITVASAYESCMLFDNRSRLCLATCGFRFGWL